MNIKGIVKRLWHFIWEDNSIWSWLVNVALAFILVKFIIYPGLGLLFGTSYPVVAVVSGSMEHDGSFNSWWNEQKDFYESLGITQEEFKDYRFKNGFNKGDIMVLLKAKNIEKGDVIVFWGSAREPIIHRIVKITKVNEITYQTKGDHNSNSREDELSITRDKILGKAVLRVPYLGWVKLIFVKIIGGEI